MAERTRRGVRYWPTATQKRLLQAALFEGEVARQGWEAGRTALLSDPPDAGGMWLRPMLSAKVPLLAAGDPLLPSLDAAFAEAAARVLRYEAHVGALVRTLEHRGIPTLLLKGAALGPEFYGAAGLRPMSDIDFAVRPETLAGAVSIATESGWAPRHPISRAFIATQHAAHFSDVDQCQVDLHWRVLPESRRPGIDGPFWDAALDRTWGGAATRVLVPADALLHVLVHGSRWTRTSGIRWVTDAVLIIRARQVDWERLVSEARRRELVVRVRRTLGYLAVAGLAEVPVEVLRELASSRSSFLERLEHAELSREPGLLGGLPLFCFQYGRGLDGHPPHAALAGFPAYLRDAWELESTREVPAAVLRRISRAVGRSLHPGGRPR